MPHMSWGLYGASVHQSGISVSVSTDIYPSVHNSHTSCFPSLWVASLLDGYLWMYAMFHAVDLLKLLLPWLLLLPLW